MSYQKGLVKRARECGHPFCISEDPSICEEDLTTVRWIRDSRDKDPRNREQRNAAYLPHSCDEWVIGGPEEIRQMIADLTALLP